MKKGTKTGKSAHNFKDLSGLVFNKLTVLEPVRIEGKRLHYLCKCECGKETLVASNYLKNNHTKSCGCHREETIGALNRSHGRTGTSLYNIWLAMNRRCDLPTSPTYNRYGGRGIQVCVRWRESFEHFLDDVGERPAGKTLDRIDNDGDYEPGNVKWSTPKEQAANRHPKGFHKK